MSWLEQLSARPVGEVARAAGLNVARDGAHLWPCPSCHEQHRSSTDDRDGPVWFTDRAWGCQRCGVKGNAVALACFAAFGERLIKGDARWRTLRGVLESKGVVWTEPPAPPVCVPPPRPPQDERRALWSTCVPVDEDQGVASWLRSRGIGAGAVAERRLCRALPERASVPGWAMHRGRSWASGWRCVFPAYGASGRAESFRARWVGDRPPPDGCVKAGAAAAGPRSATGLVLADALGRQMLEAGGAPDWWGPRPFRVVITEGEPDYLTWATRWSAGADDVAAVLGIWNGSWTPEIARRVPSGATVIVRVHHDEAGDKYADRIAKSLWSRCVVLRSKDQHAHA